MVQALRVLIIEDDENCAFFFSQTLARAGWRTDAVRSARNARFAWKVNGPFDLLVVDVALPDETGFCISNELHRDHPSVRILFVSGSSLDVLIRCGLIQEQALPEGSAFLAKPFTAVQLINRVTQLLCGRCASDSC